MWRQLTPSFHIALCKDLNRRDVLGILTALTFQCPEDAPLGLRRSTVMPGLSSCRLSRKVVNFQLILVRTIGGPSD